MNAVDPFQTALHAVGSQLGLVLLGGLGLLVLVLLVRCLGGVADVFPYQRAGALFTPAEAAFLPILAQAAGPGVAVFGKVRLADLLQPHDGLPRPRSLRALNRVTSKHVDFVLVDRDSLQPSPPSNSTTAPTNAPTAGKGGRFVDGGSWHSVEL